MKVKSESEVSQSCPTLSDPLDCSLPGSFIHGIFQARVLEWGAIVALIYCTCHFQGGSLSFSFFYLLVSSVSNFRPDTRGVMVVTFS